MSLLDNIINSKIVNGLLDRRRPLVDANPLQGFYDSAPAGSVMAPGGLLANPMSTPIGSTPGATQDMLGLLSFAPVIGDAAGLAADALMYKNQPETRTMGNYALTALGALPFVPSVAGATVFHGSPHTFDAFDMSKIGTGEGAQAYGHGLYFAENADVAKNYAPRDFDYEDALMDGYKRAEASGDYTAMELYERAMMHETPSELRDMYLTGADRLDLGDDEYVASIIDDIAAIPSNTNMYTVDLSDDQIEQMLDWDAPANWDDSLIQDLVDEFPEEAEQLGQIVGAPNSGYEGQPEDYSSIYSWLSAKLGGDEAASRWLRDKNIPGIKYFDGGSRAAGEGTRNYVVFDDQLPRILRRE